MTVIARCHEGGSLNNMHTCNISQVRATNSNS